MNTIPGTALYSILALHVYFVLAASSPSLPRPFELSLRLPTNMPPTITMVARTRKSKGLHFDARIAILDRNAVEASDHAKQVFKTTSAILALVRVSHLVLHSYVSFH